eukprot:TRINITY_DN23896_c0_g1_i1.p1 TRINITY_DN23896_c0_g1~~TRINITY_DN23896_c0_g1_i1.p1  ORF type:complete len:1447 (+),score=356.00 TRINITY_DN23896_c0_g1_i1:590-4342(+)
MAASPPSAGVPPSVQGQPGLVLSGPRPVLNMYHRSSSAPRSVIVRTQAPAVLGPCRLQGVPMFAQIAPVVTTSRALSPRPQQPVAVNLRRSQQVQVPSMRIQRSSDGQQAVTSSEISPQAQAATHAIPSPRPPGPWPCKPRRPALAASEQEPLDSAAADSKGGHSDANNAAEGMSSRQCALNGGLVRKASDQSTMPVRLPRRRPALPTAESKEEKIVVVLDKGQAPGSAFGFTNLPAVSSNGAGCLRVTEVEPTGLLAEWNRQKPSHGLFPGDFIISVNGVSGDVPRMRGLLCSSRVHLGIEQLPGGSIKDEEDAISVGQVSAIITGNSPASGSRSPRQEKGRWCDEAKKNHARALWKSAEEVHAAETDQGSASHLRQTNLLGELEKQAKRIRELEEQMQAFNTLPAKQQSPGKSKHYDAPATDDPCQSCNSRGLDFLGKPSSCTPEQKAAHLQRRDEPDLLQRTFSFPADIDGNNGPSWTMSATDWAARPWNEQSGQQQEELDSLLKREQQVSALVADRDAEIQELQRQLSAAKRALAVPPGSPKGCPPDAFAERRTPLWQRLAEDSPTPTRTSRAFRDSPVAQSHSTVGAHSSLEALEAEEEMLLKSVREALTNITSRPTSASRASPSNNKGFQRATPMNACLHHEDQIGRSSPSPTYLMGSSMMDASSVDRERLLRRLGGLDTAQGTAAAGIPWEDGAGSDGTGTLRAGDAWRIAGSASGSAPTSGPPTRQEQSWPSMQTSSSGPLPPQAHSPEFFTIASPLPEAASCQERVFGVEVTKKVPPRKNIGAADDEQRLKEEASAREWRERARQLAEDALQRERMEIHLQAQHRCKQLEAETVAARREVSRLEEWAGFQKTLHEMEMRNQAEMLEYKHRAVALAEVEQFQQFEIASRHAEQERSEKVQEQEIQELLFCVQHEKHAVSELKVQEAQGGKLRTSELQDLRARLAARELEMLALESSLAAQRNLPKHDAKAAELVEAQLKEARQAEAVQEEKVRKQAAELSELERQEASRHEKVIFQEAELRELEKQQTLAQQAELRESERRQAELSAQAAASKKGDAELQALRRQEAMQAEETHLQSVELDAMRLKEMQHAAEVKEIAGREKALEQCLAKLESQMEELSRKSPKAAPPPVLQPEPQEPAAPVKLDYIASGDDELDKILEKQLAELGPGALKGNALTRTGPKKYKLNDQKLFMNLTDGLVKVREGGSYVSLAHWTKNMEPFGQAGSADPFAALDAASPFAGHE